MDSKNPSYVILEFARIRIGVLPDDVLLEIFEFYLNMYPSIGRKMDIEAWQSLVHVCQRWRNLVLGSPRRLNLRLFCTPETPAKDLLNVWPALPLIIVGDDMALSSGTDDIISALRQSNHVCEVFLMDLADWQLEKVLASMQVPFPELTVLQLSSHDETSPVIPSSFLGGSAPRLEYFELFGIPFPELPKLLLSATHLVHLGLFGIPHSGYISPEAMLALVTILSSLETLNLGFETPQSHPDWESRSLYPPKRAILPALEEFIFKGLTEYLEDFVTGVETPQLNTLQITFFNQIDFDCPRLAQFINQTPALRALDEAHVQFDDSTASVKLRDRSSKSGPDNLLISISCREPDWQLSSIEQLCNSSLDPLSTIGDLYIDHKYSQLVWRDDTVEDTQWLQLLLPFIAVKNFYLSKEFAPSIAAVLQEFVRDRITEVLPALQNIFVESLEPWGPFQENIGQFPVARRQSGHPIAISVWDKFSEKSDLEKDSHKSDSYKGFEMPAWDSEVYIPPEPSYSTLSPSESM